MRKISIVVALVVLAVLGWGWYSPYYTLSKLRDAARAGNADYVNAHIDYPAVRDSLQASMTAMATRKLGGAEAVQHNPFARFGAAIAGAVSRPLTDALVTPEGMRELLLQSAHRSGDNQGQADNKSAEPADGDASPPSDEEKPLRNIDAGYRNWREFRIGADSRIGPVALVFQRQGLFEWKLTAVEVSGR